MIRLAVRCAPEQADVVLAAMLELAPNGVEEERGESWIEYAVYGGEGELPELGDVRAAAGDSLVHVSATEVPDDWADRWADFHRPVLVGGRIWVRPSWHEADVGPGQSEVVIDPGRAFGTGAHPTTRMCIELLIELADADCAAGALVDLGTGSGVLAIAAARLGWRPVLGCDSEPASIEAAAENARANGVEIELRRLNLRESAPPAAPTTVANLTAPLLGEVAARLAEAPAAERPRALVCSGLLPAEADDVGERFAAAGLRERERRREGDWAALLLESERQTGEAGTNP